MKTVWLMAFSASLQIAAATETPKETPAKELPPLEISASSDLFQARRMEVSINSGLMFSPFGNPDSRPRCNYTISSVVFGYMVTDRRQFGLLSGNFEVCAEPFGSWIYEGPGNFIAGYTLWGRYNFVQPGWRLIPFLQLGAGMAWTDVGPPLTGQLFNFNLDVGFGLRYFIGKQWSLNLEYRYQHISNARLDTWDLGINAQGALLGVSFVF